jgi:4-carboxymuconolactone decarboxylase
MSDSTTREQRLERGMRVLERVDGEAGRAVLDSLQDIAPELGHQVVSWAFGEIYARPTLAPRDRQLVTLGMLTALGGCEPQLEVHVNAALNVGLTPEQIIEALLHSAVYCGFPRALNATFSAKKVLPIADCSRSPDKRSTQAGLGKRSRADGRQPGSVRDAPILRGDDAQPCEP